MFVKHIHAETRKGIKSPGAGMMAVSYQMWVPGARPRACVRAANALAMSTCSASCAGVTRHASPHLVPRLIKQNKAKTSLFL